MSNRWGPEHGRRKDSEPKEPHYKVEVRNPAEIFTSIQKGVRGIIGWDIQEFPADPVNGLSIQVEIEPGIGDFHLVVKINHETEHQSVNFEKLMDAVLTRYPYVRKNTEFRQIEADGGTKFLFQKKPNYGFVVSTGRVESRGQIHELLPGVVTRRSETTRALADVADLLEFLVEWIYLGVGLRPPNATMFLQKPEVINKLAESSLSTQEVAALTERNDGVTFADIGGNEAALREMKALVQAIKHPEIFIRWGTRAPKGVLLWGPPGVGKTQMVRAVANEADAHFEAVTGSEINDMFYGQSERNLQKKFDDAKKRNKKTILFFDEIDKVFHEGWSVDERVLAVMQENLDGMKSTGQVMVIAATNRRDIIPEALIRSGRFDRWIEVPLPDEKGRRKIFEIHIEKSERIARRQLFRRIKRDQWDQLLKATEGFSGADIETMLLGILNLRAVKEITFGRSPQPVSFPELIDAALNFKPQEEGWKNAIGFPGTRDEPRRVLKRPPTR